MGRKLYTTLPILRRNIQPKWPDQSVVRENDRKGKAKQAYYYNGSRLLPPLRPGDKVLSKLDHQRLWASPAVITGESIISRSYILCTQDGDPAATQTINAQTLPEMDSQPLTSAQVGAGPASQAAATTDPPLSNQTVARLGRVSRPVQRLNL